MANPRQGIEGATRHGVDGATRGLTSPGATKVPIEKQDTTKPELEPGKTTDGGNVPEGEADAEAEAEARRKAELAAAEAKAKEGEASS